MGRRQTDSELGRCALLALLFLGATSCCVVYTLLSAGLRRTPISSVLDSIESGDVLGREEAQCCRGIEHLELWGDAVKWGADFKVNSSEECCRACKAMCSGVDGPCLCDSWVFCGNREACGAKFGECWLKKQKYSFYPDRRDSGEHVMWTSGLIFGKGEGIVGLQTEYGVLHIELFPDCAPHSVAYILELLRLRHCVGCQLYRAEIRGTSWDSQGNHIKSAPFGPPFALIQGTLAAHGTMFKEIPTEECPQIRRGSVAWVGSGPEFFISLANHNEWSQTYTVFGSLLPEDLEIAEKIAQLPTKLEVWSNIDVSVLDEPIRLRFIRVPFPHKQNTESSQS